MNLKVTFPSEVTGAVLDVQKGRAITSLTIRELEFISNLHSLLTLTGIAKDAAETQTAGAGRVLDITPVAADATTIN